jgi:hypothetical protein
MIIFILMRRFGIFKTQFTRPELQGAGFDQYGLFFSTDSEGTLTLEIKTRQELAELQKEANVKAVEPAAPGNVWSLWSGESTTRHWH